MWYIRMFENPICFISELGSLVTSRLKWNIHNNALNSYSSSVVAETLNRSLISGCAATGVNTLTSATLGLPTFCLSLCWGQFTALPCQWASPSCSCRCRSRSLLLWCAHGSRMCRSPLWVWLKKTKTFIQILSAWCTWEQIVFFFKLFYFT